MSNKKYTKQMIIEAAEGCTSIKEVQLKLGTSGTGGGAKAHIKKLLIECGVTHIPFSENSSTGVKGRKNPRRAEPIETVLTLRDGNKSAVRTHDIKLRLFREGVKEKSCEMCGLAEWNGKEIPLALHHIDGNRLNNVLENLQILCYNCHGQTESFAGKSLKGIKRVPEKQIAMCASCGRPLLSAKTKTGKCLSCLQTERRTVARPDLSVLFADVAELGFCGTGRKYGVTDSAIRKWMGLKK